MRSFFMQTTPLSPYEIAGGAAYHAAVNGGLGERGFQLVACRRAAKLQPYVLPTHKVLEYVNGKHFENYFENMLHIS